MSIKKLGKYQWEWLNKYDKINLIEWKYDYIDIEKGVLIGLDWYYVGNWQPTVIEPHPSQNDGGYKKRRQNLKNNPYFYWPTN